MLYDLILVKPEQ